MAGGRSSGRVVPETKPATNGKVDITSARKWQQQAVEGEEFTMPGSGNVVRLRRIGLQGMVTRAGHVPNPLSRQVRTFLAKLGELRTSELTDEQRDEILQENSEAAVTLLEMSMVEPTLVRNRPADVDRGEIAPEWVPDYDYNWFVYTFLEGDAARLAEFRVDRSVGAPGLHSGTLQNDADTISVSGSAS